jgi:hypothetical protein
MRKMPTITRTKCLKDDKFKRNYPFISQSEFV